MKTKNLNEEMSASTMLNNNGMGMPALDMGVSDMFLLNRQPTIKPE